MTGVYTLSTDTNTFLSILICSSVSPQLGHLALPHTVPTLGRQLLGMGGRRGLGGRVCEPLFPSLC